MNERIKNDQNKQGKRYNQGKLRWRNVPKFILKPVIEVGHYGENKYGDTWNFLKGLSVSDCLDSMDRHRDKLDDPRISDYDEESKLHHLAHIGWNALVALYMIQNRPDLDDRLKLEDLNLPDQNTNTNKKLQEIYDELPEEIKKLADDLSTEFEKLL